MIVLDTNVMSELMRPAPDVRVVSWIASQSRATLYTTSVCKAEILYGIHALPDGKRRTALAEAADSIFSEDMAGRVLPFDGSAAGRYAEIVVSRRRAGYPMEAFDALIAATATAAGASIATRDVGGFAGCGVEIIDPWSLARRRT